MATSETYCWQLQQHAARLVQSDLEATINLLKPREGLSELSVDGRAVPHAKLLGVQLPELTQEQAGERLDAYARQGDLIATYSDAARQLRVQVYWRSVTEGPSPEGPSLLAGRIPAIDLQVSVNTPLLDAQPTLFTGSRLPAEAVFQLVEPATPEFRSIVFGANGPADCAPTTGVGCFLMRMASTTWTYVELIHPSDFCFTEVRSELMPVGVCLRHELFADSLEKGVILRARLRGLFVPREDDWQHAARAYREFVSAPLPLTT